MEQQLQLDLMEQRLDGIEHKVDNVGQKVDKVTEKVDKMMFSLVGTDLNKNAGLIEDIFALKKDVQAIKERATRQKMIISIIVAAGLVLQFIINIYVNLKKT